MKWELTSKVLSSSCVQIERLFHSSGFPAKLISIVSHLGAPFIWTREAAILAGRDHLLAGDLAKITPPSLPAFLPPSLSPSFLPSLSPLPYLSFFLPII